MVVGRGSPDAASEPTEGFGIIGEKLAVPPFAMRGSLPATESVESILAIRTLPE